MKAKTVWVVGIKRRFFRSWEICGIFNVESKAIQACVSAQHFIGPVQIGVNYGSQSREWKGAYYPLKKVTNE